VTLLRIWQARFWVVLALVFGVFAVERVYRSVRPRPAYPAQDTWANAVIAAMSWVGVLFLSPFVG